MKGNKYTKLAFIADSSSEDDAYPAQALQCQTQQTRGWQSEKFCAYPQEIIFRFESFARIRQIQILCHEFKICERMEVSIGTITAEMGDEDELVDWKLLGTLNFDSNENSGFLARELKSVQVTAEGELLKFAMTQCSNNRLNTYNQVGIVAVNFLGELVPRVPCKRSLQSAVDLGLDPASMKLFQTLMKQKDAAVAKEDYDEAKRLKFQIEEIRKVGKEIARLENAKQKAVEVEDYDLAKSLKLKIQEIRDRGTTGDRQNTNAHLEATSDALIRSSQSEVAGSVETIEIVSEKESKSSPDGSADVSPENGMRSLSISSSLGRTKHDEYDNRIAKAHGSYNSNQNETPILEKSTHTDNPDVPEGFPTDLPQPESISAAKAKESLPLEQFAGKYIAKCFYSRNWQLREAALHYLEIHYERLILEGMEREQHRLLCQTVRKGLQDKVANVYLKSTSFIRTLMTSGSLGIRDIQFATSDFLPILLEKLGDTNPRIKDASQESIVRLAKIKESGIRASTAQFLQPPKKQSAWRPLLGRLEVISELLDVIGIGKSGANLGFELEQLMPFVSKGFLSPNVDVRSTAIALTAKVAQVVGPVIKRYIPSDVNPKVHQQLDVEILEALSSTQPDSPKKPPNVSTNHVQSPSSESHRSPRSLTLNSETEDPAVFELEIQKQEQVVGKEHPDLCEPLNSLALIYNQRGEYDLAFPLLKRVLDISEIHYGKDHTNVAHALTDLALLHMEKDEEAEGRLLLERALSIQERNLGPDHPDVEAIRNVLTPADET